MVFGRAGPQMPECCPETTTEAGLPLLLGPVLTLVTVTRLSVVFRGGRLWRMRLCGSCQSPADFFHAAPIGAQIRPTDPRRGTDVNLPQI